MKKVTIRIRQNPDAALKDMGKRFVKTWKSGRSGGDTLEFDLRPVAWSTVLL